MRTTCLLLLLVLVNTNVRSQAIDFVTGLNQPRGIVEHQGFLYIAENDAARISRVDLSASEPVAELVVAGADVIQPFGLAVSGNELYYTQVGGEDRISKIDLLDPNPTPVVVAENIDRPFAMEFYQGELYIAQFAIDRIVKIDPTVPNPPVEVVIENIETPYDLEVVGDEMYVVGWADDVIYKFDLTTPNPVLTEVVSNLLLPVGLKLRVDELYIAEAKLSIGNDRISKIIVTDPNPVRTTVVEGLYNPTQGLEIFDDVLYIAENFKISSFELPPLLTTNDFDVAAFSAYPNPTSDAVNISGLKGSSSYMIYNVAGMLLDEGTVAENEMISVESLSAGVYFLVLEDNQVVKIVKQ